MHSPFAHTGSNRFKPVHNLTASALFIATIPIKGIVPKLYFNVLANSKDYTSSSDMLQELRELASFMPTLGQLMQDDSVRRLVNQLPADNGKLLSLCHTQINLTHADAVGNRICHIAPPCAIA